MKKKQKDCFKNFHFVLIEKPCIGHLRNIDVLHELPFYDELSIVKISQACKKYARSCKIEIIDPEDPLAELETSESSIEDLFKDLLDEIKGCKISNNSESFAKQTQRLWTHGICSCLFQFYNQHSDWS